MRRDENADDVFFFFLQPWLDGKHTIFGRATQGLDVIHKIESTRTHKEKPEEDIKILNIDVM